MLIHKAGQWKIFSGFDQTAPGESPLRNASLDLARELSKPLRPRPAVEYSPIFLSSIFLSRFPQQARSGTDLPPRWTLSSLGTPLPGPILSAVRYSLRQNLDDVDLLFLTEKLMTEK
jgi:hypothetical protein